MATISWPSAISPSIGSTGVSVPVFADFIGGVNPEGALTGVAVSDAGHLLVDISAVLPSPLPVTTTQLPATLGNHVMSGSLSVTISSDQTVPISAVSLPLPTGASTSALQTTGNTTLSTISSTLSTISGQLPTTLGAHVTSASLAVNIASDQVVPVSLSSVPLPTGAATSANQTNGSQKTQIVDGSGNVIASTSNALNSFITNSTLAVTQSGTWNINNISGTISLPTGASTSALQTTGNTSLSSIVTNTNNLSLAQASTTSGQVGNLILAAATTSAPTYSTGNSYPLSLTTVGALRTDSSGTTQPVSGTVTANAGTGNFTVVQATASNLNANITNISGTISLPTGAATSANQTNGSQKTQLATPTALTVTQAAISVGTSAVRLTVSGSAPASTRVVLVANMDSAVTAKFYIGSSSVTNSGSTRGVELVAGQSFIANNDAGDYWIVSNTASQTIFVMEQA